MNEELQRQLDSLARDDCYRVDAVLKNGELERTERVYFVGVNGSEQGPYIRKRFDCESGLGGAYRRILEAQQRGERFLHLPHIIDCYEAGEQEVVVMECVPGRTLADEVFACDPSIELAQRLFPLVCDAVRELHERFDPPLIHRDIKPSNFMVSGDAVFIIDLGIARTFDASASSDTSHFGTRAYAPPEQFGYGQTDERSDVYALGMLLFYLLCEQTPVAGDVVGNLSKRGTPEALRHVVAKASSFDPSDRFQSVTELVAAFEQACKISSSTANSGAVVGGLNGNFGQPRPVVGMVDSSSPGRFCPGPVLGIDNAPVEYERQGSAMSSTERVRRSFFNLATQIRSGLARGSGREVRIFPLRVPLGIGVVWDVLVVLWVIVITLACVLSAPTGSGDVARLPFAGRVLSYLFTWMLLMSFVPLVADLRPARKLWPKVAAFGLRARLVVLAVMNVAGLLGLILIGNLMLPYYQ